MTTPKSPSARLAMKRFASILAIATLSIWAKARETPKAKFADRLQVGLRFEESDGGVFIITVTSRTKNSEVVLAERTRFHGSFIAATPEGTTVELIDPAYLNKALSGYWLDPPNRLSAGESLRWEIPIRTLVERKTFSSRTRKFAALRELRGLSVYAEFKRLGIKPKTKGESFNDRNAAQRSNKVRIPRVAEPADAVLPAADVKANPEDREETEPEPEGRSR